LIQAEKLVLSSCSCYLRWTQDAKIIDACDKCGTYSILTDQIILIKHNLSINLPLLFPVDATNVIPFIFPVY